MANDDIGFDANGDPFVIGEEARQMQENIIDDPNSIPVMVVAYNGGGIGVRVFGPPDPKIAEILKQVLDTYLKALALKDAPEQ